MKRTLASASEEMQGFDDQGNALPPSAIVDSELPRGWRWVRVSEIGEVQLGRQRAPKHQNGEHMRPYLRVANVFEDRFDLSDVLEMNFTPAEFKTFELKPHDILLNEGQSLHLVGRPALYRGEIPGACFQNTLVRFRPGPLVDPKFALTIFRGYMHTGKFQKIARWTTNIAHLGASRFAAMPFPLPPLNEQQRIVAEIEKQFTRLEAGVASLKRVQATLKRYRASVLKAAREGRLVPTQSKWRKTTLGEVSTVLAGYGFPERLQGRASGEIAFFKVGDISRAWKRNEKVLRQANHYISKTDLAELRAKLLPVGSVVFAKIGAAIALNRRAIIGEPALVDNNVMGLAAGKEIDPRFLFHFVCTLKLDELARATTVPSIRKGDVECIELDLPALAEQYRIVAKVERRLSVVEELEAVVAANLQRATRLRQSVLLKAFSGELL